MAGDPIGTLASFGAATRGWFWAMSSEGGSTTDYDYYEMGPNSEGVLERVRGAGTPNWWGLGSAAINGGAAAWTSFFNSPVFNQAGSPGKRWMTIEMNYEDGQVELFMTPTAGNAAGVRTKVAGWTVGATADPLVDGIPAITYYDPFNSIAGTPADQFALIDNVAIFDGPGDDIPAQNHFSLGLNLLGETGVVLEYRVRVHESTGGEPLDGPQQDEVAVNAVLISDDNGSTWHEIASLRTATEGFEVVQIPLDDKVRELGLVYTETFQVRFSQTGSNRAPRGGYDIDFVRVVNDETSAPSLVVAGGPFAFQAPEGTNPLGGSISVSSSGLGAANFTVTANQPWIGISRTEGSTFGDAIPVEITINSSELAVGLFEGEVTVEETTTGQVVSVPVSVRVLRSVEIDFDFDTASLPWTGVFPAIPEFTGVASLEQLVNSYLLRSEGKIAVGFLESPVISPSADPDAAASAGQRGILASNPPFYEIDWNALLSSQTAAAPAIRLRVSGLGNYRTDMLILSPEVRIGSSLVGGGTLGYGTAFRQLVPAPAGGDSFRLFLDIISATPADAEQASVELVDAKVRSSGYLGVTVPLATPQSLFSVNLRNQNSSEFVPQSIPDAFAAPERMQSTVDGLLLAGRIPADQKTEAELGAVIYGSWLSPAVQLRVPTPGRLVRVRWTVTTEATNDETRAAAPPFRLRLNSDELVHAFVTVIDSMDDGAGIPISGESQVYDQYFYLPANVTQAAGTANPRSFWTFAFDYLYTEDRGDDATIGVILQGIDVELF